MQLRRDQWQGSISPLRELFGRHEGRLVLPLDLCIMVETGNTESPNFPANPGHFNGAPVVDTGGGSVGTVAAYDWPAADIGAVRPYTMVQPAAGADISGIPPASAPDPNVREHDVVRLEIINDQLQSVPTGVTGAVAGLAAIRMYPDLGHRVLAYRVDFGQNLLSAAHGMRVCVAQPKVLLGMLIATQNQPDGKCHALVYPAHLF